MGKTERKEADLIDGFTCRRSEPVPAKAFMYYAGIEDWPASWIGRKNR
jgi:hypothetical protein